MFLNIIDLLNYYIVKKYFLFLIFCPLEFFEKITFKWVALIGFYIKINFLNITCFCLTLITPAPVCANMIQTLVHTCRGLGCSIFIETNVKRQSNPLPFKVCSIQQCTEHIQPSTIISKNDSKKCVHFGTTARVIRVNP